MAVCPSPPPPHTRSRLTFLESEFLAVLPSVRITGASPAGADTIIGSASASGACQSEQEKDTGRRRTA
jgi:hypothetical protein